MTLAPAGWGGGHALAASAVIQAALGIEFTLSGLNKVADRTYVQDFASFVRANPGSVSGPLASLVQDLVLPNAGLFATLLKATELLVGAILMVGALEIGLSRLGGRLAAAPRLGAVLNLAVALAGLAAAGLTLSIFVLMGGSIPTVMPGRAFTTAIPVELLIVPFGLSVAWLEAGRFIDLRRQADRAGGSRTVNQPAPVPAAGSGARVTAEHRS
jgi:hypothetical protein